jgi:hypothetical protein
MYPTLIVLHSWFRWLVLLSLVYSIYRGWRGWSTGRAFTRTDDLIRHNTATIGHIQLLLGLWLYSISPLIDYFLKHYSEAVHQREIRFFGMEHSLVMFLAITVLTIGSMRAKRQSTDAQKFKTMAVWNGITLLLILSSVPWAFSPLVSRPWFRMW